MNCKRPAFGRLAAAVAALIALGALVAGMSPTLASTEPHPALADCKQLWNDSSAEQSCHTPDFDTEPGNCVVSAQFERSGTYGPGDALRDGCARVTVEIPPFGPPVCEHWCSSTVTFSLNDTTDPVNCDGALAAGSSCRPPAAA